jgi:hypothetical protein
MFLLRVVYIISVVYVGNARHTGKLRISAALKTCVKLLYMEVDTSLSTIFSAAQILNFPVCVSYGMHK